MDWRRRVPLKGKLVPLTNYNFSISSLSLSVSIVFLQPLEQPSALFFFFLLSFAFLFQFFTCGKLFLEIESEKTFLCFYFLVNFTVRVCWVIVCTFSWSPALLLLLFAYTRVLVTFSCNGPYSPKGKMAAAYPPPPPPGGKMPR